MEDRQSRCTLYSVGVLGEGEISNGTENISAAITEESFPVITECLNMSSQRATSGTGTEWKREWDGLRFIDKRKERMSIKLFIWWMRPYGRFEPFFKILHDNKI